MPRFVILFHQMPHGHQRQSHWDLMLESDMTLATWALAQEPCLDVEIEAEELVEHRKAYLDYEGPVSGNRGTVSRWDSGSFQYKSKSDDEIQIELHGEKIRGKVVLSRQKRESQRWVLIISGNQPR